MYDIPRATNNRTQRSTHRVDLNLSKTVSHTKLALSGGGRGE